jgi:hypothetical protein
MSTLESASKITRHSGTFTITVKGLLQISDKEVTPESNPMIRGLDLLRSLPGLLVLFIAAACTSAKFTGVGRRHPPKPGLHDKSEGSAPGDAPALPHQTPPPPGAQADVATADPAAAGVDIPEAQDTGEGKEKGEPSDEESITVTFVGESRATARAVDIVFALDSSGSMSDEKMSLEANMSQFIATFAAAVTDVDYQIYMIGENFRFPEESDKVIKVDREIDSHDVLKELLRFFDGKLRNPKPLRADAFKEIVVITDDDAWGVLSHDFKSYVERTAALRGKTSFNGFVGLSKGQKSDTCDIDHAGAEYMKLAADPQLGGLMQDLCEQDWSRLLRQLADKIIKPTGRAEFELDQPADASKAVVVRVDGDVYDERHVTFDAAKNLIIFKPAYVPKDGAEIVVTYTPLST